MHLFGVESVAPIPANTRTSDTMMQGVALVPTFVHSLVTITELMTEIMNWTQLLERKAIGESQRQWIVCRVMNEDEVNKGKTTQTQCNKACTCRA